MTAFGFLRKVIMQESGNSRFLPQFGDKSLSPLPLPSLSEDNAKVVPGDYV